MSHETPPSLIPAPQLFPPPARIRSLLVSGYLTFLPRVFLERFAPLRLPGPSVHIWYSQPVAGGPPTLSVSGPSLRPAPVRHAFGPVQIVGLHLQPGAAATVLGAPATQVRGTTRPLAAFWGLEARLLEERLQEVEPEGRLALLFEAVAERVESSRPGQRIAAEALRRIEASPGALRIEPLAEELGLSSRHLHRLFLEHVGCTPKQVMRMTRLTKLFALLHEHRPRWAQIAAELAYADQSHLIADFRSLTGQTPHRFATTPRHLTRHLEAGWLIKPQPCPKLPIPTTISMATGGEGPHVPMP